MFEIKAHIASLLLLVILCNVIEQLKPTGLDKDTPTWAALFIWIVAEVTIWIFYWGFL